MTTHLIDGLIYAGAIIVGGIIGLSFGKIQILAQQRYAKQQKSKDLKNGLAVVPGSLQRVAIFLIVLVLIQIGLPFLFDGNIQWIVTAGVVLGYGWTLLQLLKKRTN